MTRAEVAPEVAAALAVVSAAGYVAVRAKSYQRAQERQRVAEALLAAEVSHQASTERWARDCLTEERRLGARLTYVYGVAIAHGATHEELAQDRTPPPTLLANDPDPRPEGHRGASIG